MIAAAHLRRGDVLVAVPPSMGRPAYDDPPRDSHRRRVTENSPRAGFPLTRRFVVVGGVIRIWETWQLLEVEAPA